MAGLRQRARRRPGRAARATTPAEELIVLRGARARSRTAAEARDQSVGRRAVRPSDHEHGSDPARRGVPPALRRAPATARCRRAARHRARRAGPLPAAEHRLGARHRAEVVVKRPVAVVGVGQTQHEARRSDLSIPGLVREAVDRALADAGLEHKDIDAVVIGKAPDMLEGVMQPEQFLVGALGAHMKPMLRVHTAGSVGASTAITAVTHVASGLYDRVLTVAFEKQSEGNAMWALSPTMPFTPPLVAGAGGFFAPYCRAYMTRRRPPAAHRSDDRRQRARQRGPQRVRAPARAHDGRGRDELARCCGTRSATSRPARRPTAPIALVVANEETAKKGPRKPAWIKGAASYAEAMWVPGRDQVSPDAPARSAPGTSTIRPGITNPWKRDPDRRDLRPVLVVRGDVAREPRLLRRGRRLEGRRSRRAEVRRAICRSIRRAACCAPTRSARRACCASARPRCR